ncbi:MAG: glycine cleavage system protein GcvH [Limisphaerales bacterium]
MSNIPSDLKFAKSHEWVRVSGDIAAVGITDHAQSELTDVVFVELPRSAARSRPGEACAVVESVKTASDIYSPVSGEIVELNKPVTDNPALVNTEPYAGGWFFKIKLSDPAELNALLSPEGLQKADWKLTKIWGRHDNNLHHCLPCLWLACLDVSEFLFWVLGDTL